MRSSASLHFFILSAETHPPRPTHAHPPSPALSQAPLRRPCHPPPGGETPSLLSSPRAQCPPFSGQTKERAPARARARPPLPPSLILSQCAFVPATPGSDPATSPRSTTCRPTCWRSSCPRLRTAGPAFATRRSRARPWPKRPSRRRRRGLFCTSACICWSGRPLRPGRPWPPRTPVSFCPRRDRRARTVSDPDRHDRGEAPPGAPRPCRAPAIRWRPTA